MDYRLKKNTAKNRNGFLAESSKNLQTIKSKEGSN
jgi:hypothetical protein